MCRAASCIDVESVRLHGGCDHFHAELTENEGGDGIGCAVRAVENRLDPLERMVFDGTFRELDVTSACVVDTVCLADSAGTLKLVAAFGFEDVVLDA